jgi:hypothetical protein
VTSIFNSDCIGGVIVRVPAASPVDRGFELRSVFC